MQSKNIKTAKYTLIAVFVLSILMFVFEINYTDFSKIKTEKTLSEITYFKDFSLETVDGGTFTSQDVKDYKLVVYNGWGPWCPSCTAEMPDLEKIYNELKDKGVLIVGIVADYPRMQSPTRDYHKETEDIVTQLNITYPIPLADEAFIDEVYPTMKSLFPTTWIVDNEGNIAACISGEKSKDNWINIINDTLIKIGEEPLS